MFPVIWYVKYLIIDMKCLGDLINNMSLVQPFCIVQISYEFQQDLIDLTCCCIKVYGQLGPDGLDSGEGSR